MAVTLARLLKYKNRVVERLRKLERDIQTGNVILKGGERDINIRTALEGRLALEKHLIELKLTLEHANTPIKPAIHRLQELKGRITFFQSINTTHGVQDSRRTMYGEQGSVEYEADIRKTDVDSWVTAVQEEIDALQEQIDQFNNTTKIDWQMLPLK